MLHPHDHVTVGSERDEVVRVDIREVPCVRAGTGVHVASASTDCLMPGVTAGALRRARSAAARPTA